MGQRVSFESKSSGLEIPKHIVGATWLPVDGVVGHEVGDRAHSWEDIGALLIRRHRLIIDLRTHEAGDRADTSFRIGTASLVQGESRHIHHILEVALGAFPSIPIFAGDALRALGTDNASPRFASSASCRVDILECGEKVRREV